MIKNKFLILFIITALSLPVYSVQEEDVLPVENSVNENVIEETQSVTDNEDNIITDSGFKADTFKKPSGKRKIVKKFGLAMLGAVLSSVLIFAVLSVYNSLRRKLSAQVSENKEELGSLETPDNLNDAVKSFLDRTHWDN